MTNKRVFVIVIDSLGVGSEPHSIEYGDDGANTLKHIFSATNGNVKIPNLQSLGLCNLTEVQGNESVNDLKAYYHGA